MRHLIAHPPLCYELNDSALNAFSFFGEEPAERLLQLVAAAQGLGPNGSFAALSQHLKATTSEYDELIAEIASEPESEFDSCRLWLAGAVRQVKMNALKKELDQLFSVGLTPDQLSVRYREITAEQEQLRCEERADVSPR